MQPIMTLLVALKKTGLRSDSDFFSLGAKCLSLGYHCLLIYLHR